mmetsp:Transcript_35905/g.59837  ORF Transcript_35905/g.59837 Transcript_35905/m.59837 type:complete len:1412 (-) Transcript_35905:1819-6054(-)
MEGQVQPRAARPQNALSDNELDDLLNYCDQFQAPTSILPPIPAEGDFQEVYMMPAEHTYGFVDQSAQFANNGMGAQGMFVASNIAQPTLRTPASNIVGVATSNAAPGRFFTDQIPFTTHIPRALGTGATTMYAAATSRGGNPGSKPGTPSSVVPSFTSSGSQVGSPYMVTTPGQSITPGSAVSSPGSNYSNSPSPQLSYSISSTTPTSVNREDADTPKGSTPSKNSKASEADKAAAAAQRAAGGGGAKDAAGRGRGKGGQASSHSDIERRRRDLINERISKLKDLVPDLAGTANKATVLGRAIDHMADLREENDRLKEEVRRLKGMHIGDESPSPSPSGSSTSEVSSSGMSSAGSMDFSNMESENDAKSQSDKYVTSKKRKQPSDVGQFSPTLHDPVLAERVNYEPIATIGRVQSHGLLFVLKETDLTIVQVSMNVEDLLGLPVDNVVGRRFADFLDQISFQALQAAVTSDADLRLMNPVPMTTVRDGNRQSWDGVLHRASSSVVVELEPVVLGHNFQLSDTNIRAAIVNLENSSSVENLCQILAQEVSDLTQYSRVMVYKFGEEGHGKVLGEVLREPDLEPYLGLNFPATDIPTVARNLFLLNRVRVIANSHSDTVEVVPSVNPMTERPLDMSRSVLRAVSTCHTQYLHNMGVSASVSNAIVKDNKLWGLFICYSSTSRTLSYQQREGCILLGRVLSVLLARREQSEISMLIIRGKELQSQLFTNLIAEKGGVIEALYKSKPNVTDIIQCGGGAIWTKGKNIITMGKTPSAVDIKDIVEWLHVNMTEEVWYTDQLREHYEGAENLRDVAAGLLVVALPKMYVMWFRAEVVQNVSWGGSLKEMIIHGENGELNPRASFQKFVQQVKGRAVPFNNADFTCARALRMTLADVLMGKAGESHVREELVTLLNEKLERTTSELQSLAQELGQLIDTMPLPVFGIDTQGLVTEWNPMASKLTGISRPEALGTVFVDKMIAPEFKPIVRDILSRVSGQQLISTDIACPIIRKTDNARLEVGIHIAARRDVGGTVIGALGIVQSVNDGADAADTDMITSIGGSRTDEKAQAVNALAGEMKNALSIVAGELLLSEISGQSDVRLFDLHATLRAALAFVGPKVESKKVRVKVHASSAVPQMVCGDESRMLQLILNLLMNAIEATDKSEVVAKADILDETADHMNFKFEVSDTNAVLPEQDIGLWLQLLTNNTIDDSQSNISSQVGLEAGYGVGNRLWFTINLPKNPSSGASDGKSPASFPNASKKDTEILLVRDPTTTVAKLALEKAELHTTFADSPQYAYDLFVHRAEQYLANPSVRPYDKIIVESAVQDRVEQAAALIRTGPVSELWTKIREYEVASALPRSQIIVLAQSGKISVETCAPNANSGTNLVLEIIKKWLPCVNAVYVAAATADQCRSLTA